MSDGTPIAALDQLLGELLARGASERLAGLAREADPRGVVESIGQRGADLALADTARGEAAARLAVELADAMDDPGLRARTRVALGHVLNYATRFDEALGVLAEASTLATACGDRFAGARASLVSMHGLARLGRMEDALAAGDRAIAAFDAIGEPVWRAKADVNVGVIRRMRDDPGAALAHFESAREVFGDNPQVLAQVESNLAEALLDLGRFGEAEGAFTAALRAFTAAGVGRAAAIAEGNLADLLSRQGRVERALTHFERARRGLESVGAPADLARLRAEEAEALASIGMLTESAGAFREAIAALETAGLPAEQARARVGLARVLARFGRSVDAAAELRRAITGFDAIPNPTGSARAGVLMARLLLLQGQTEAAGALLDRLEPTLAERPIDELMGRSVRASVLLARGSTVEAMRLLDGAIARARELGMRPLAADLLHERARGHRESGGLDAAIADLDAAIEVAEQIRGSLQADRLRAAAMGERSDVYEDSVATLLERAGREGPTAEPDRARAFEVVDLAKARALMDLVRGGVDLAPELAAVKSDVDRRLVEELGEHRAEMNAVYSALFASQDRRPRPDAQRELAARLDAHEQRIAEIERRLSATKRYGDLAAPSVGPRAVRASLREGETLVEFFGTRGALGAAIVTRTGLQIREAIAPLAEIEELGERLSLAIDREVIGVARGGDAAVALSSATPHARSGAAARILARLHALVLAPLEPDLAGAQRLIIVPHGPLHSMPLHAATGGGSALVEHLEVVYIPSAALLCHARRLGPRDTRGAPLVVGVPDDFAPEMGEEAAAVADLLPGSRLLVGGDATFAAFAAAAPRAPLIHLACHGVFPSRNPLQARLRFSDGWVTVRDLLPLSLPRSVVILSGCETGRAGVQRGDEAYGLGRALLAAGASAAVLSLWPVHDRTTRELMKTVYQALSGAYLEGEPDENTSDVATAMAVAQRRLLRQGAPPAIWAPFIVFGEPSP